MSLVATVQEERSSETKLAYRLVLVPGFGSCFLPGSMIDPENPELDIKLRRFYFRFISEDDDSWKHEVKEACTILDNTIFARGIVKSYPDKVELYDQFSGEFLLRISNSKFVDIKTPPIYKVLVQKSCKWFAPQPPTPTPGIWEKAHSFFSQILSWGSITTREVG